MQRILIVEDDVQKCLELSEMLGEFGFETGVADNSFRALSMLSEADPLPNLILLDMKMPNSEGRRLRETLRHDERYCNIPIVKMDGDKVYPAPKTTDLAGSRFASIPAQTMFEMFASMQ